MPNPIRVEVELSRVPTEEFLCEIFSGFIDVYMGSNLRLVARNVKDIDRVIEILESARESLLDFPSEA